VDVERTALLVEYAAPMQVTFHRAFDLCREPKKALEDIIFAGAARILTSGQARSAIEGASVIKDLITTAGGREIIMPGGGITEYNIALLATTTGAREYHLSARRQADSLMTFRRKGIYMGDARLQAEYSGKIADADRIRSVIMILGGIVL
jgi:copper homeostasis protein